MMSGSSSPMPKPVVTTHVVGIDIGMESCTMACLTMDKRQVIKSTPFANTLAGLGFSGTMLYASLAYSRKICERKEAQLSLSLTWEGLSAKYFDGCQSSSGVEQRTHKPLVGGSIPSSGTT